MSRSIQMSEEEQVALANRVAQAFSGELPVIVPDCVARGVGRMPTPKQPPTKAKKLQTKKPTAASQKKKAAASGDNHKKNWPKVQRGDWDYVYVCGGAFQGRFGYYDDHEEQALVYFDRPCGNDGPYDIPLRYLRAPPKHIKDKQAAFRPF
jgi:hypothetical protein